jgi:hypothetical protein
MNRESHAFGRAGPSRRSNPLWAQPIFDGLTFSQYRCREIGIGLATCRAFVNAHGRKILTKSGACNGPRIVFTLLPGPLTALLRQGAALLLMGECT